MERTQKVRQSTVTAYRDREFVVMSLGASFWRFWAASGLSNIADGVFQVALPLLALELTRSPLLISGLEIAAGLPWLVFALVAGAIADRVDRRRLMAGVDVVRAVLIGGTALIVLTGVHQLWMLYLIALALGMAETLFDTSAQAVLPMVVAPDDLDRANSRMYGIEIVGNYFVGPPLGGLLVGISMVLAFAGSGLAYLAAAGAVATIAGRFRPTRAARETTLRADIGEGLRYLWADRLLRRLALLVGGIALIFTAVNAVLPVFAVAPGPMGLSATGYGFFIASTAIGAVVSSTVAERVAKALGPSRALKIAIVAITVANLAPLAVFPWAVAALWFVGAFFMVIWNVITVSVRQRIVPEHLMGRVNASYRLLTWGSAPLGAAAGGVLGQVIGLKATFAVAGGATLLLLLATGPLTDSALLRGRDSTAGPLEAGTTGEATPAGFE